MGDFDFTGAITFYVVLLVSLVFHEASHALVALLGGDKTAYEGGQVTLNPVPHIQREPFGTVILPIAVLVMSNASMCMGFAHAPYDPLWAERHPKRAALMAAAGPFSNLLLALVACLVLKGLVAADLAATWTVLDLRAAVEPLEAGGGLAAVIRIASVFLFLNVVLAILNLFPFAPFDGGAIVEGMIPASKPLYNLIRSNPVLQIGLVLVPMYVLNVYGRETWYPVYNWFYAIIKW